MRTHYIEARFMKDKITMCGLKYVDAENFIKLNLVTFGATCNNCNKSLKKLLNKAV